jgi:hypothetical protein
MSPKFLSFRVTKDDFFRVSPSIHSFYQLSTYFLSALKSIEEF